MEAHTHSLEALFAQLGLDNSSDAIDTFVQTHSPIPAGVALHQAAFWNTSQATFLVQMKQQDADWAEIVDQLDAMLR